ncbi:MAG: hypothetical protein IJT88_09635, partial [Kiritimatiellae bacterium]|nr:hypothetical protein [Kiritimatiellia bacterium]
FVPPTAPFRYYIASADRKTAFSKDPDALRAALDLYPSIPALLPAEGDIVKQYRPDFLKPSRSRRARERNLDRYHSDGIPFLTPDVISLFRRHVDTVTAGLGIDADTLALQAVLTPLPTSKLADLLASCGPIPAATACVNLPGAIASFAAGPAPSLPPGPLAGPERAFDRYLENQPFSATLYPPAPPSALPRALAFFGLNDLPDARSALHARLARHSDALSIASPDPYRDIAVDTLSFASPDALADLLDNLFGPNLAACALLANAPSSANVPVSLAWLPDGLLVAVNDPDSALLHAAIDATLDGGLSTLQFEQSPAFRAAYPYPDGPALVVAHLDLPAILDLLPWKLQFKDEPLPTPCPIDLFAYIASDASLVTRLRAPASLLKAIKHGSISPSGSAVVSPSGGAGGSPAVGGSGAKPPSIANPSPSPDGGPSARQTTPLSPTPFMGYPEAYVLSNAHLHAVVVPAISRLAFLAPSADAPNLLRLDPALAEAGATPPDPSTAPDFFNIGGDWVWPVPQSDWPSLPVDGAPYGRDWPPPPPLADAPSAAKAWVDEDGTRHVVLTRHYPPPVTAFLCRHFILAPDSTHLRCEQDLVSKRSPAVDESPLPLVLWHISQAVAPTQITFPVPEGGVGPTVMAGSLDPDAYSVEEPVDSHPAIATYTPPPSSEVKFSTPATTLFATTPGGILTVHASPPAHTEIYSNTGLGYAELETVTPESPDTLSNTLTYIPHPAP